VKTTGSGRSSGNETGHGGGPVQAACPGVPAAGRKTRIGRHILVMSGKGGVGKSTIATNLAVWLAGRGRAVGLLDIDLHGPSIPKLLGMESVRLVQEGGRILPARRGSLRVISVGFMLANVNQPVIWRGPAKHGVIERFVRQVDWSDLNELVIDCPPGTGDETLSIVQLTAGAKAAVVVTTPQAVATVDVRKCLSFCRELQVPVLGVVENMSGLVCPHCRGRIDVFGCGGGEALAREFGVPFAGCVPLDPTLLARSETGDPVIESAPESAAGQVLAHVFQSLYDSRERITGDGHEGGDSLV